MNVLNTATPPADTGLARLQDCYDRWVEIEELIFAADVASNDVNPKDKERVMMAILGPARRLAHEFGNNLSQAVRDLGGNA